MQNPQLAKKSFIGASIGTMLEYYDYSLFIIFLPILSPLFFKADSAYHSLVKGYSIIFIAMLTRPLGGVFFGYLGDVIGRRNTLLTSMYGIAFATMLIAITPSYTVIGIWAIIIITFAKSIQTLCFAGEYSSAGIYVVEHAQNKNEALIRSLLTATTVLGSLIAAIVGFILTLKCMPDWSWRIAFALGSLVAVFAIIYRKNLLESPAFKHTHLTQQGWKELITQYPRELIAGIFLGGFAIVPYATAIAFICPVLMTKGYFSSHQFMFIQSVLNLFAIISLVLVGITADRTSTKKVMRAGCWALIIFSYPALLLIDEGNIFWMIVGLIILVIINEIGLGPCNAYLKNIFPMHFRCRGASIAFSIGMAFFGGLTPIIENQLYQLNGQFKNIAIWLVFLGIGTLLSLYFVERKKLTFELSLNPEIETQNI